MYTYSGSVVVMAEKKTERKITKKIIKNQEDGWDRKNDNNAHHANIRASGTDGGHRPHPYYYYYYHCYCYRDRRLMLTTMTSRRRRRHKTFSVSCPPRRSIRLDPPRDKRYFFPFFFFTRFSFYTHTLPTASSAQTVVVRVRFIVHRPHSG